jgi:hypothetical protein
VSEVKGAADLKAVLAGLGPRLLEEGGRALYQEALVIQKASMKRTPVDTRPNVKYPHTKAPHPGALRASHETTEPELEGGALSVRILVGGPAAPYALPVHERLDVDHPIGEAKFLENSLLEASSGLGERVARRIDLARAARR